MVKRIAGTIAVVLGLGWLSSQVLALSNSRTRQLVGELVTRVETVDSIVALTFDDGPIPAYTDSILAMLSDLQVPATFFMVGRGMERNPGVAERVLAAGHELGNHSYTHRRLVLRAPGTIREEIQATDSLIRAAGHSGEIYVRPPYGKRLLGLPLYLSRNERPVVLWDLEPDTYNSTADGVVGYVNERVRPGSIILLHVEIPSRAANRAALPGIVSDLKRRGYRFVTLSQLMESGRPSRGAT